MWPPTLSSAAAQSATTRRPEPGTTPQCHGAGRRTETRAEIGRRRTAVHLDPDGAVHLRRTLLGEGHHVEVAALSEGQAAEVRFPAEIAVVPPWRRQCAGIAASHGITRLAAHEIGSLGIVRDGTGQGRAIGMQAASAHHDLRLRQPAV